MATSANTTLFQTSLSQILDSWTVLKLAVEHGFGGGESREKAEWMVLAIDQWFKENKNLDPYEVEEFLADILNAEFDTIADDGSLPEIASMICGVHRLCSNGDEPAVRQRLQHLQKPSLKQCARAPSDDEEDNDEDDMDTGPTHHQNSTHRQNLTNHQNPTQPSQLEGASSESITNGTTSNESEMEDDGWTTVHRGKRK
ncbi:pre-rRNA-processing protein TSR2 homolog [Mytilus edulis]|uniref:pre-rRNA-processing protein TSR2 homolog n=1 Tax=Mytilus edulis TaxID=6550 RepID=UPI0039EE64DB